MTIRVSINGNEALKAALLNMSDDVKDAVGDVVMQTAAELEADIKLRIQSGPKTGRTYRRRGVTHQASAPGETPASDTGVLVGSIYHERESELAATVGSRLAYAMHLEHGTIHMAARPVWTPAAHQMEGVFHDRIEAALKRETR